MTTKAISYSDDALNSIDVQASLDKFFSKPVIKRHIVSYSIDNGVIVIVLDAEYGDSYILTLGVAIGVCISKGLIYHV